MKIRWTQHIRNEDEKQRFNNTVWSAKVVLDRALDILKEEENAMERTELSLDTFEKPNWAERQAYMNGYKKALRIAQDILNLDQQKGTQ